jgi:zinc protease
VLWENWYPVRPKVLVAVFLLVICGWLCWDIPTAQAVSPAVPTYRQLQFEPLPPMSMPRYERWQLSNGLVVYLIEDHELPLVSGSLLIRSGDRWDPPGKTGLADLSLEVLRQGGSQAQPVDRLNQLLEGCAAAIETSSSNAIVSVSFQSMSQDWPQVFSWVTNLVRQPAFPELVLKRTLNQARNSISRRNDQPAAIARREFIQQVYGADSPYAREFSTTDLDNIHLADVQAFWQRYFQPNQMILGLVGDLESKQVRQWVASQLGDWQATPQVLPRLAPVNQAATGEVTLIDRPFLSQSYIQMGQLGGTLGDPDYPALALLNELLNSFGGRLYNEIRNRQGLAYSVNSVWQPGYDYPGLFVASAQTQTAKTGQLVESLRQELEKLRQTPVSAAELQQAKESLLNAFVFNFQDPSQTLQRLLLSDYFGYSPDRIFQFQKAVRQVTVDQVRQAAQRNIRPDQFVTVIVGNQQEIEGQLESTTFKPAISGRPLESQNFN